MKRGFTLIELLVTISIIGILLGIISVGFSAAQKRTRDSRRQGDLQAIQKSLEQCYALETEYPDSIGSGLSIVCGTQTVMTAVPFDPKNTDSYVYTYNTSTGNDSYCLCGLLEKTDDGNASDTGLDGSCNYAIDQAYYCVSNQQ